MFYSHDLLGRKTPLGAIWTLAHGRKLSKGKIVAINLREICDEILQPGVPHSLRLQGILIGGLVLVFNKQQMYLLEDLQEMMRRVKAASDLATPRDAPKTEKGKGKAKTKQLTGNNQARLEAITMMDMEDLLAPAVYGDDDILGLLGGGSLSDALASQGALPADRRAVLHNGELAGDLFMMPSLRGGTTSETGGDTDAEGRPISKRSSRGTRSASAQQQPQQQEEEEEEEAVYGGVVMMQHDWVNPEDEVFPDMNDLNADLDLLGDLPPPPPATHSDKSRDQTTSQQHKQATTDSAMNTEAAAPAAATDTATNAAPGSAAGGRPGGEGTSAGVAEPYVFDGQLFVMEDEEMPPAPGQEEQQQPQSDEQQGRDQTDAEGQAVDQVHRAKQRKRKGGAMTIDDLDNLMIRSSVYREWSMNSSPLLLHRNMRLTAVNTSAAAAPLMAAHLQADSPTGPSFAGMGLAGTVPLCRELQEVLARPLEVAAEQERGGGGKAKRPQQPSSPEVNNSTGDGTLPGVLPHSAHKMPLDLHLVPEASQDVMMQEEDMHTLMEDESVPHPEEQELMSNDEAHDQLGDLPFNGDIEVERLRAAATPGSSDGSLPYLAPGGSAVQRAAASTGHTSHLTSTDGSGLAGTRVQLGVDSEAGGSGLKRRLGSADLGPNDDVDLFFGTGNLADMLPDIQAEHWYEDMQREQLEEGAAEEAGATAAGRAGSLQRSSRELTPYNSSQFPLLEETEPDQATQLPHDRVSLNKTTQLALSIFQERLKRSGEQEAAAAGDDDAGHAAAAAAPCVSFFGLIKEGRLSRNQAANLFYQVCVTSTAGYITAQQARPYGDITIKQGSRAL